MSRDQILSDIMDDDARDPDYDDVYGEDFEELGGYNGWMGREPL